MPDGDRYSRTRCRRATDETIGAPSIMNRSSWRSALTNRFASSNRFSDSARKALAVASAGARSGAGPKGPGRCARTPVASIEQMVRIAAVSAIWLRSPSAVARTSRRNDARVLTVPAGAMTEIARSTQFDAPIESARSALERRARIVASLRRSGGSG